MKAVALLSGGLDSTLAAKLILDQGIEVVALNFTSPFCMCDKRSAKDSRDSSGCRHEALEVGRQLGIEVKVLSKGEEYLEIIKNPEHGYGSNMNPCIDCRIFMFKKAKEFMQELGASFIITGEVVGQRPMSQQRHTLSLIDKRADVIGLVLRPLSAKLLPETLPEKNGWVNRDKLLEMNGRGRRPQMDLAEKFNIKDYPCAAGGCLLTDPEFSRRLRDLLKSGELNYNEIELLKLGRHFRLSPLAKLIVGRDEAENNRIISLSQESDYVFMPQEVAGPTCLLRGEAVPEEVKLAASLAAHYCDKNGSVSLMLLCTHDNHTRPIETTAALRHTVETLRI